VDVGQAFCGGRAAEFDFSHQPEYQHIMQKAWFTAGLAAFLLLAGWPDTARAQYKNSAFGLDAGYMLITQPSITDRLGNQLSPANMPVRLGRGIRLGGETNFKLHADRWWFSGRLDASVLNFSASGSGLQATFDQLADATLGTILGIDGVAGVRYYLGTDHFRPYIQLGVSYMHMFVFSSTAGEPCDGTTGFCPSGQSNIDAFLPHTNLFGLHLTPGVEFIVSRDVALHLFVDYQRWVVINADDNNVFNLGLGLTFYG
jgi:hypothetical protein